MAAMTRPSGRIATELATAPSAIAAASEATMASTCVGADGSEASRTSISPDSALTTNVRCVAAWNATISAALASKTSVRKVPSTSSESSAPSAESRWIVGAAWAGPRSVTGASRAVVVRATPRQRRSRRDVAARVGEEGMAGT